MNPLRFIDLFAGIGGFRLALESLGMKCIFSSDIDKYARKTYYANFHEWPMGDIRKIKAEEIPEHDILCGGFPCQPFSTEGKRRGVRDPRGTLFWEILRILDAKRPSFFILENVRGLISIDKGETFKAIIFSLQGLGYWIHYKLLDARDFGLPQYRERIIIIGFRDKKIYEAFRWPPKQEMLPLSKIVDFWHRYPELEISEKNWRRQRQKLLGISKNFVKILYPSSHYSYTLVTSPRILVRSPIFPRPRYLSIRESARLQGFPDDFIFPVSRAQAYKQIGNAVPPPMIKAVGEALLRAIKEVER